MNLTDAIRELRELRYDYNVPASMTDPARNGAYSPPQMEHWHRLRDALDLAIAIMEEKPEVALARKTDPATSHRAAPTEFKAGSAREKILLGFYDRGVATARGICKRVDIDPHRGSPWKRVSELKQAGYIKVVNTTKDATGHEREVYGITEKGQAAAREIRQGARLGR